MRAQSRLAGCVMGALLFAVPFSVYSAQAATPPVAGYELALVDLKGRKQVLGALPASVFSPRVSPDGRSAAFEMDDPAPTGGITPMRIWIAELKHLDQRRALPLVGTTRNMAAVWSTDGKRVVFQVAGDRPDSLFWRSVDGVGEAELLTPGRAAEGVYANDGQVAFITLTGNRDYGISLLDMSSKAVTPLIDYPGSEQHSSRISPDGRWIAYASNETGKQEVWIEPLPQTGARYRITHTGGRHPLWSPDGKWLYFDEGGQMFRVELFLGSNPPKTSEPKGLPIKGFQQGDLRRQFDLLPNGRQFLMLFPVR